MTETTPKASETRAMRPEDLTALFVAAAQAKDADGIAALYAPDAVMAFPPGRQTVGREAIRALWAGLFAGPAADAMNFEPERIVPTVLRGDLALTATIAADGTGARAQVAQRQPDGSWLRVLDQPEFDQPEFAGPS